jgi:hypothetical protein
LRAWVMLLGGLLVWAAHFFLLYALASLFPGQQIARTFTLIATVPALAADVLLLRTAAARALRTNELDRWVYKVSAIGAILSLVTVVWQALPALLI